MKEKLKILPSSGVFALFLTAANLFLPSDTEISALTRLISIFVGALVLTAAAPGIRSVFCVSGISRERGVFGKILLILLGLAAVAASIYCGESLLWGFADFSLRVVLMPYPRPLICALFLAFCAYLGSRGVRTLRKYAFCMFVSSAVLTFVLFLLALPDAQAVRMPLGKFEFDLAVRELTRLYLPLMLAAAYLSNEKKGLPIGAPALGVFSAAAVLALCHFTTVLTLGQSLAAEKPFPYSAAVSAVTLGTSLRLEGLSYGIYFASASVALSSLLGLTASVFQKLVTRKLKTPWVCAAFALIIFIFSVFRH